MKKKMQELKTLLTDVMDLRSCGSLLFWDQQVNLPAGGGANRAHQMAIIQRLSHEMFTNPKIGRLLDKLQPYVDTLDPDGDDARLIKVVRREYDRALRLPPEMVAEKAKLEAAGFEAWKEARARSDFSIFQPHLEKILDYYRRMAQLFAPFESVCDPLIERSEPEMTTAEIHAIFDAIKSRHVAVIKACAAGAQVDDAFLHQPFDPEKQWAFSNEVITAFGYDWNCGHKGKASHPFCTTIGHGDVRITTRVYNDFLNPHLFATMHECGHALYNLGLPERMARSPLFHGSSAAVHESQSRMWENLVGRSRPFWTAWYPRLQEIFPGQLDGVSVDSFYKGINRVQPSLIRVEADEATYNLHILLRFELETAMLEGRLEVKDLPEAWNESMRTYLGITPPDAASGVLQDVHWSSGYFGYFPSYALGNIIGAQIWEKIEMDIPDLYQHFEHKDFTPLLEWLRSHIHCHGAKFTPQELLQKVTGSPIDGAAYIRYLEKKFGEIYGF